MLPWFRPWMVWAAAVLALTLALAGQTVRLAGARADLEAAKTTIATMQRDSARELAAAQAEARRKENELRDEFDAATTKFAKEKADAKAREDALVESVRTGNRRLSIAAARCVPAATGTAQDPAAAGGPGPDGARAELDPATAERVLAIPRDGDEAIRERNACFAAYERVRRLINGSK